jgi:dihydroxy-acid dehydratase
VVFTSLADLSARIDDPDLDVTPTTPRAAECRSAERGGMPESGYLPIPKKLAAQG